MTAMPKGKRGPFHCCCINCRKKVVLPGFEFIDASTRSAGNAEFENEVHSDGHPERNDESCVAILLLHVVCRMQVMLALLD